MKGLVYHGPGQRSCDEVADPTIEVPTDAIVRIDSSTICGTDLHILKGDVPACQPGTVLGHEAVGTIVEKGAAVTSPRSSTDCPGSPSTCPKSPSSISIRSSAARTAALPSTPGFGSAPGPRIAP